MTCNTQTTKDEKSVSEMTISKRGKVYLVGHRANSVRRIRRYIKTGVDYIEVDVTLSEQYGEPLVYHGEPLVSASSKTEWRVRELLSRIQGHDRFVFKPLTIVDLLEFLNTLDADVGLWIDLKTVPRERTRLLHTFVESLKGYSRASTRPVIISSNDLQALRILGEMRNRLNLLLSVNVLYKNITRSKLDCLAKEIRPDIYSFNIESYEPSLAEMLTREGAMTAVWTINRVSGEMAALIHDSISEKWLDFIITDTPENFVHLI